MIFFRVAQHTPTQIITSNLQPYQHIHNVMGILIFDFGIFYWSVVRIHIYITIDYDGIWRSL